MATRAELLEAVRVRYRDGTRPERSRILNEFAAITGYHRKHAIRLRPMVPALLPSLERHGRAALDKALRT